MDCMQLLFYGVIKMFLRLQDVWTRKWFFVVRRINEDAILGSTLCPGAWDWSQVSYVPFVILEGRVHPVGPIWLVDVWLLLTFFECTTFSVSLAWSAAMPRCELSAMWHFLISSSRPKPPYPAASLNIFCHRLLLSVPRIKPCYMKSSYMVSS